MKTLFSSLKLTLAFSIILCIGYAGTVLVFAKVIRHSGGEAETAQVGQRFSRLDYFWGRPDGLDQDSIMQYFLKVHPYLNKSEVPSEMVTESGSGMDPDISPEGAYVQIRRVAKARNMDMMKVGRIVKSQIRHPFLGRPYVNVFLLNEALDKESMCNIR